MGCGGDREKGPTEQSQKWDYITLSDFKSTSSWNTLAYMWLWLMALVSVAVYAADTFTAVNLLAFNHWTSKIEPVLDIKYSRWIFAGCIIFSWALAVVEWIRAIRVIRRGGVAESYMDPVAVSLQSMRPKGWRRFLVFSALTTSKKGTDYIAFFVYFEFKGAVRVILAEGPRQVINGMTLYAAAKSDLFGGAMKDHSSIESLWLNVQTMFDTSKVQAITMLTMLFTATIWVFSAICLIAAAIFYITFIWHYVPQSDGRLSIYCRRKIDKRLEKIVEVKVKAAIEEEDRLKRKAEHKADLKRQKTGELPPMAPKIVRQPTLPQLGDTPDAKGDDKLPEFGLARQNTSTTVSTLPPYDSRPPTRNEGGSMDRKPALPDLGAQRPAPSRSGTQASGWSNASYASNAPLLSNAGYAGDVADDMPSRPPTAFSRQDSNASYDRPMPSRNMTQSSMGTQRSYTPMSRMQTPAQDRPYSPMSQINGQRQPVGPRMPVRTNTGLSYDPEPRSAHTPISPHDGNYPRPVRQNTSDSFATAPSRQDSQASYQSRAHPMSRQQTSASQYSQNATYPRPTPPPQQHRQPSQPNFARPFSPAAPQSAPPLNHQNSYEMLPQPSIAATPASAGGFVAFNPSVRSQASTLVHQAGPQRSVTVAGGPGSDGNYFGHVEPQVPQRSVTAPPTQQQQQQRETIGYSDFLDGYGDDETAPPPHQIRRAGTGDERWQGRF
ncbi:Potassium transporter [Oleoguttula sp. CCFEE 5521]